MVDLRYRFATFPHKGTQRKGILRRSRQSHDFWRDAFHGFGTRGCGGWMAASHRTHRSLHGQRRVA